MSTATHASPTSAPAAETPQARGLDRLAGHPRSTRWSESGGRLPRRARAGRPRIYTRYSAQQALLDTAAKRWWTLGALLLTLAAPFLLSQGTTVLLATAMVYAVAGIGLNLLTGYAGQISLGHPFFMALGAYTAAVVAGRGTASVRGWGLDLALALPLAALVPALVGLLVAPLAVRVRGLYLAILTLGLLMIGEQVFKQWRSVTGGSGVGRGVAQPILFGQDMSQTYALGPLLLTPSIQLYLLCLGALALLGVMARNLARSRTGRAFAAVRDRDIAAQTMGVDLLRTKTLAFALSSAYAGLAGALLSLIIGRLSPEQWNVFLSIQLLAVIVIGGVATITGTIIGAAFVVLLPRLLEMLAPSLPLIVGSGSGQGLLSVFQLQTILFGLLIVLFLTLEPRGLLGLWHRIRVYLASWPFRY